MYIVHNFAVRYEIILGSDVRQSTDDLCMYSMPVAHCNMHPLLVRP